MDRDKVFKSDFVRVSGLVGLCLGLGVYSILTAVLVSKDSVFYISQAQNIAHDPAGVLQRHPGGYPFLLWVGHEVAAVFGAGDSAASWIHTSQAVTLACRALALIALYFLGKRLVGGSRAFWAVLILIVLPYPAQYGHDVLRDWPYMMFLSVGLWLLYWAAQRRAWWMFALVGLAAALGYSIQPVSAQLLVYGLLAAIVVSLSRRRGRWRPLTAVTLLIAGFIVPVLPYVRAAGSLIPPQLQPSTFNSAPTITSVGGKGARSDPLEFEAREGGLLEISVEASDAQDDDLSFSLAGVPVESRPVYQLRLAALNARFQTISQEEKEFLLETYPREVLDYDGIICYAYAAPGVQPGLAPVHRFWSSTQDRHFYTIDESEKEAILAESAKGQWTYEGIAFYAFPDGRQPPDAVPVRRFWNEQAGAFLWAVTGQDKSVPDSNAVEDEIAWHVHVAGEPPAGMALEGSTLRWQPAASQQGNHQVNIIVSDGRLETCQLVRIKVLGPQSTSAEPSVLSPPHMNRQSAIHDPQSVHAGLGDLPGGVDRVFDGIAENLMIFFLLPWCLGLYYRMRYEADRLERTLTTAILIVNVALVLARHVWIGPGSTRRYLLGVTVLTIFYVPVGLELIARWLTRTVARARADSDTPPPALARQAAPRRSNSPAGWFVVLTTIGIAICLPKLLTPLYVEMRGYRPAIEWLRDNTQPQDTIATPDNRLTFYAQRQGLVYTRDVDPRRVDYIVRILDKGAQTPAPQGWSQAYSLDTKDRRDRTLVIYKTHRRQP